MRISDWSSDVCSSDLLGYIYYGYLENNNSSQAYSEVKAVGSYDFGFVVPTAGIYYSPNYFADSGSATYVTGGVSVPIPVTERSDEHKSELHSLMRNSYAVFCLKKTKFSRTLHLVVQLLTDNQTLTHTLNTTHSSS